MHLESVHGGGGLELQGIKNFQEREAVEIRVPSADPSDSVLPHENGGVCIVEQIA